MSKINYFDKRELLVRREIETNALKGTKTKGTQVLPGTVHIWKSKEEDMFYITDHSTNLNSTTKIAQIDCSNW